MNTSLRQVAATAVSALILSMGATSVQAAPSASVSVVNTLDVNPGPGVENGFVFTIANTGSGVGSDISSFGFTLGSGFFDTANGGAFGGLFPFNFYPLTAIPALTVSFSPATVADGANSISLNFTGFSAGETFRFGIDADTSGFGGAFAPNLNGSSATIGFSGGGSQLLSQSFGGPLAPGFSSTFNANYAVPEPGSLALLGIGLAGLGMAARRRVKAG